MHISQAQQHLHQILYKDSLLKKKLIAVFEGSIERPAPIWLMRQAGRYLPEYKVLREKAGSFWGLCMDPTLAAEVTLQPVRRFDMDAAIVFSDIFVVPTALGLDVRIEDGIGPRLDPIDDANALETDERRWAEWTKPVYEALGIVRENLSKATALIGFAGAPWTLATYLAHGGASPDQRAAKLWGHRDPAGFSRLLDALGAGVARHLVGQLKAGADVVQIFESWGGGLPPAQFRSWVVEPTAKIVEQVRREVPGARIIGFPRTATLEGYALYAQETGVDAVSLDTSVPLAWATQRLSAVLQGNLDPIALIAGGSALDGAIDSILAETASVPFVFNLGHGILPETPIAHVEQLVRRVRGG